MDNHHEVPRRRFLTMLGGTAAAAVLSSCGSDAAPASGSSGALDLGLVGLFSPDNVLVAGSPQRVTFAAVGPDIGTVDEAAALDCRLVHEGSTVTEFSAAAYLVPHDHDPVDTAHEHSELLRYYAAVLRFPEPGIYDIEADFGPQTERLPIQAFDPSTATVLPIGAMFPTIDTPTVAQSGGVNPICTRSPQSCGFHEHTPAQLLATGQPFVLLVASPAYCATSYCSSLLELLVRDNAAWPNMRFIHAEVYADALAFRGDITNPEVTFAPIIEQLGLDVEPTLFVVDSNGIVQSRLDNVFGRLEFEAAVSQVLN